MEPITTYDEGKCRTVVVGYVNGKVFIKDVNSNKHLLRKIDGYAIQTDVIHKIKDTIDTIQFNVDGVPYYVSMDEFLKNNIPWNSGHGAQLGISREHLSRERVKMKLLAVDTETTGLDSFNGDKPFAITTCDEELKAEYIAIGEDDLVPVSMQISTTNTAKVFHNAKFDILMLETCGIKTGGEIHDTLIMAHVFNPDESNKQLKHLAEKYLGIPPDEQDAVKDYLRKHKLGKQYAKVPREIMEPYALKDAVITMKLFNFYKSKGVLDDPTYKTEMKLLHCLLDMQRRGVLIDTEYLKTNQEICWKRLNDIQAEIAVKYGDINIGSNKQLGEFLFDKEGIQCNAYSAAGNPVLDEYHLEQYEHPIIELIMEYRDLTKVLKTYIIGIGERCDKDEVIHCNFYQVGAKTGRFSCREPNLQNIPRGSSVDIRRAFICRPDYTNYYFDYSQIELRVLAHYSKEEKMIVELTKPEGDLHGLTAQGIFGDDFTKEQRGIAKSINFGIVYGMGPKKLAETLNRVYPDGGYNYTKAKGFIDRYYNTYFEVRKFTWDVPRAILERGHVKDVFGRRYTCDKTMTYKAVNYLIQGCAAGILKDAMLKVHSLLRGTKSSILLTIHDEIVIEIHKDEEVLVKQIKRMMEDHDTFRVPITVNVEKSSTNWAEKES